MKLTLEGAKELLLLDKHKLDEACMTQADLFYRVGEEHANAVSLRDFAKENLAKIDAEVAGEIRKESEHKGEKLTETKLQQVLSTHPKHLTAVDDWLEAKLNAERWGVLKDSFLQRASMLKELCGLFISGYYSEIEVKGNKNTEEIEYKSVREKLAAKRRERNR